MCGHPWGKHDFGVELATLGYPGFAYLKTKARRNPAVVLLDAPDEADLDTRVAGGSPVVSLGRATGDLLTL
jgi:hypothetical protein